SARAEEGGNCLYDVGGAAVVGSVREEDQSGPATLHALRAVCDADGCWWIRGSPDADSYLAGSARRADHHHGRRLERDDARIAWYLALRFLVQTELVTDRIGEERESAHSRSDVGARLDHSSTLGLNAL